MRSRWRVGRARGLLDADTRGLRDRVGGGYVTPEGPAYEVRPWERDTFGVMDVRTHGFAADDTWLTKAEAQCRADEYNADDARQHLMPGAAET